MDNFGDICDESVNNSLPHFIVLSYDGIVETRNWKKLVFLGIVGAVLTVGFLFLLKNDTRFNPVDQDTKLSFVDKGAKEEDRDAPVLKSWPLAVLTPAKNLSDTNSITASELKDFFTKKLEIFSNFSSNNLLYESQNSGESSGDVQKMSDSEIFDKMWPKEYREGLRDLEDTMIKDGFIKPEHKSRMASDGDMFAFYKTTLEYARSKLWVSEKEYKNLLHGVTVVLPEIVGREKAGLRLQKNSKAPIPGRQRVVGGAGTVLMRDILDGLFYVFSFAEPANAAWFRDIDCYKDDIPIYPIPGPNLWSFCCNCGLLCTPKGCIFFDDCGPEGAFCNKPLGCLNLACRVWPNAIWSPITGSCGCG